MKDKQIIDYQGMIVIHGDLYKFTDNRDGLQPLDGSYTLKFRDLDGYYSGRYDLDRKIFRPETNDLTEYDKFWWPKIYIPDTIVENIQITEEVIKDYNQESLQCDHGFYFVDKDLSDRLNGALPILKIDGIEYEVDVLKNQISQKNNPDIKFTFSGKEGWYKKNLAWYDLVLKQPFHPPRSLQIFKEDIVSLEFPDFMSLDPLAYHRKFGRDYSKLRFYAWRATEQDIVRRTLIHIAPKPNMRTFKNLKKPKARPKIKK